MRDVQRFDKKTPFNVIKVVICLCSFLNTKCSWLFKNLISLINLLLLKKKNIHLHLFWINLIRKRIEIQPSWKNLKLISLPTQRKQLYAEIVSENIIKILIVTFCFMSTTAGMYFVCPVSINTQIPNLLIKEEILNALKLGVITS